MKYKKYWMILSLFLMVFTIVADEKKSKNKVGRKNYKFEFKINPGEYMFVGYDVGKKTFLGMKSIEGVYYHSFFHLSKTLKPQKIIVKVSVKGKGIKFKDYRIETKAPRDSYQSFPPLADLSNYKKRSVIPVGKMEKIKYDVKFPHSRLYKVPYLKIDGEVHFVIILITNKLETAKKEIKVTKLLPFFQWKPFELREIDTK
jgi:hypothetical protein